MNASTGTSCRPLRSHPSCWRQYVVRGGKVSYLRSQAASVGIMQNQRVWRGYDMERVRWDMAYNIRAPARRFCCATSRTTRFHSPSGPATRSTSRARRTPSITAARARSAASPSRRRIREARVDERLWTLYRAIAAGGDVDLASCSVRL